ncbi:phosphoribosylamine--glycine ligase [Companilactobacillus suantsaicola]|uniref:Phosphoribosylamine--glycine ligase n=1 Tax=Companilactobacillus suantsaicola TaxID=2487723 RepID=A0A4Z0JME3_9LACO|nr:phosphoribosylamine--glycine ligase [Companilactobacillus suantsaicola]TGD24136.1 phosphoribosylamine--glycine ligase [Companilactobacillus suantsaicola]
MKILVIGSGAREDAICKALLKNKDNVVFCAPGNDGMKLSKIKTIAIDENDFEHLAKFAETNDVDFSIVGPEEPLVNGIVDFFKSKNLRIFGPNQEAAQVEGSKTFTKKIMADANISTAQYQEFTNLEDALAFLKQNQTYPIVIKANGLAAGKGVFIVQDYSEAKTVMDDLLDNHKFNTSKVIIEDYLEGEEFSLMAFVDHKRFYPMPLAQDYKKIFDGDLGPNTGGMGAVCPVQNISQEIEQLAVETVLQPFVSELRAQGIKYTGILYAGLILTKEGIKVIEFNARFGDPETEVVLPRLKTDLASIIDHILRHKKIKKIEWKQKGLNLGVFAVSQGYPQRPTVGTLGKVEDFKNCPLEINFASVKKEDHQLFSNGGRLYLMKAHAKNLLDAQTTIYEQLGKMNNNHIFYRKDIGCNSID